MDIHDFFREDERPLENLVTDGGFAGVFRTIGCIGDSLSSGEFQAVDASGNNTYYDMFDYSWGQYLARMAGIKVYNFSRGGMTAKEYYNGYRGITVENGFWERGSDAQAYIIALGVNDASRILGGELVLGTMDDVNFDDLEASGDSFIGYYARIIGRILKKQPDVHFFLMTVPRGTEPEDRAALYDRQAEFLYALADKLPRCWVMDFRKYAPIYDEEFRSKFFLSGHMNPAGYILTAKMVASYLDYIIRHNMDYFHQIPFIGTDVKHPDYFK